VVNRAKATATVKPLYLVRKFIDLVSISDHCSLIAYLVKILRTGYLRLRESTNVKTPDFLIV